MGQAVPAGCQFINHKGHEGHKGFLQEGTEVTEEIAVTCFRFFGQLILLFWMAGGELSDVEEQFREAR